MKKFLWVILGIALVGGILYGNIQQNKASDNYRVMGFVPLTGKMASPGTEMSKGMELAVEKWNQNGGLLGKRIDYKVEDTKGEPTEAITIYQRSLAGTDNKPIAIQSIVSGVTLNLKNFTEKDGIPLIGAIGSTNYANEPNAYSLRNFMSPNIIGQEFVNYIHKNASNKQILYFYENSEMSLDTKRFFLKYLGNEANIKLFDFDSKERHFRELIQKANPTNDKNIVVITGMGSYLGILIKQLREYGYTSIILSDTNTMISGTKDYAGEAMKGVVILDFAPNSENEYCKAISEQYEQKYGKKVPFNAPYIAYQGIDTLLAFYQSKGTTDIKDLVKEMEGFTHSGCLGTATVKNGELYYPATFQVVE